MTAYYKPGMSEAEQRAISAKLPQAERDQLYARAVAALPPCWDSALERCANLTSLDPRFDCQTIADGWTGDFDKMEATFEALPRCDELGKSSMGEWIAGGIAAAVVLGVAIKMAKGG